MDVGYSRDVVGLGSVRDRFFNEFSRLRKLAEMPFYKGEKDACDSTRI